jgi:hypothetical protein
MSGVTVAFIELLIFLYYFENLSDIFKCLCGINKERGVIKSMADSLRSLQGLRAEVHRSHIKQNLYSLAKCLHKKVYHINAASLNSCCLL